MTVSTRTRRLQREDSTTIAGSEHDTGLRRNKRMTTAHMRMHDDGSHEDTTTTASTRTQAGKDATTMMRRKMRLDGSGRSAYRTKKDIVTASMTISTLQYVGAAFSFLSLLVTTITDLESVTGVAEARRCFRCMFLVAFCFAPA
ncbi:hypothetical protein BDZ89DRAFT_1167154, partial [Hymenopellis radicata]